MHPRAYAITLSACALSLFLAVAGTNLVIDPMGVFGTKFLRRSLNANDRYARLADYQAQPDRFDGLLFGSSRSQVISREELSRRLGGVTFANFGVVGGTLTDHVAVLDYVLRQKGATGRRIKTIFILLDPDSFGRRPFTDESLTFAMPPALSGESPVRFWWRNLTAIQFGVWRSALKEASRANRSVEPSNAAPQAGNGIWSVVGSASLAVGVASAQPMAPSPADSPVIEKPTERPLYPQHLELWRRFVTLCRENNIELVVAISPLSQVIASQYDPSDLARAIDDINRLAPVWDFTDDGWIARDPELWTDVGHFGPEIARMMLARMFGDRVPPEWDGFGHLQKQRDIAAEAR